MRIDRRAYDAMRRMIIKRGFMKYAEGSCLIEIGNTRVICTASLEEGVPQFLRGTNRGWITAEYSMLPRSCKTRIPREAAKGKIGGRTHEIQRLIGRSLRAVVDMTKLGERTIWIDCDVIQGDGGTRTASITGSFIALCDCLLKMKKDGVISELPVKEYVAATSVGIVNGRYLLDLNYEEDANADVDMNIVMTSSGRFIEIQGTAEKKPFDDSEMKKLILLARKGLKGIMAIQKKALAI